MAEIQKPDWWTSFSTLYNLPQDPGATINSYALLDRLNRYMGEAPSEFGDYLSNTRANAFPATDRMDIAVLSEGNDFLLARRGSDYISAHGGDDVLYGDADADIFHGGAGADLIIGNTEHPAGINQDTVSYLDATSAVTAIMKDGFSYVNDGSGSYDILYGIENLIGSDFSDRLEGQDINNILTGGLGDDRLEGHGGNDILTGGEGNDKLLGDEGNDVFLAGRGRDSLFLGTGQDKIVMDATILDNIALHRDYVHDFQAGPGGDKLDVSALLFSVGYMGRDPVADGYIRLGVISDNDLKVEFDVDGKYGPANPQHLITMADLSPSDFSVSENLITEEQKILYAPVLGQSNAKGLSASGDDSESGITHLVNGLLNLTDYNQAISVVRDSTGQPLDTAIGGTTVDGDRNTHYAADLIWWYPDENKPGEILVRAVDMMAQQMAGLRSQNIVTPVVIWGQGEAESRLLATAPDPLVAMQRYEDATLHVFDYIKDRLGDDIQFYIMETGRYNVDAAHIAGESEQEIQDVLKGVDLVRTAQQDMALARPDVHLAMDYSDLRMLHESDPAGFPTDVWHMNYDDREIMGDRLAGFIAADLGYNHVIHNPGNYPVRVLADLTFSQGFLHHLEGTSGNDQMTGLAGGSFMEGHEGNDKLVALGGENVIEGGTGKDSIILGPGQDTVLFGTDLLPDVTANSDFIRNFQPGAGGDKLDFNGLLTASGYKGTDPFSDGYITLLEDGTRTKILFDADGHGGGGAHYLATLDGITPSQLLPDNFIIHNTPFVISGLEINGNDGPDLLIGTQDNDNIHGLEGHDMLVGGPGSDNLYGGGGSDDFIFDASLWQDILHETPSASQPLPQWADIIQDFTTGQGGDRIDIDNLLDKAGYAGIDPGHDGYLNITNDDAGNAQVRFDPDGAGVHLPVTLAVLTGVTAATFSFDYNLVHETHTDTIA